MNDQQTQSAQREARSAPPHGSASLVATHKDLLSVMCAYACGEIEEGEAEELLPDINTLLAVAVERGKKIAAIANADRVIAKANADVNRHSDTCEWLDGPGKPCGKPATHKEIVLNEFFCEVHAAYIADQFGEDQVVTVAPNVALCRDSGNERGAQKQD